MKHANKEIYADIEEVVYNNRIYYKVIFTTTYDIIFFGKCIKQKTENDEVPFLFKELDIAKDFCSIHPKIYHTYIVNSEYYDRNVYYETYRLEFNNKCCYIRWFSSCMHIVDDHNFSFDLNKIYVVDTFVDDIILKDWMHTHGFNYIEFIGERTKLSEYTHTNLNKWHFKLVEND